MSDHQTAIKTSRTTRPDRAGSGWGPRRRLWLRTRAAMEHRVGDPGRNPTDVVERRLLPVFGKALRISGLWSRGFRNAHAVALRELTVSLPDLPAALDGYRVLHLTDLHLDGMPGLADRIIEVLRTCSGDLCVFTGDFRLDHSGDFAEGYADLAKIVEAVQVRDGIFGVLGNHDSQAMVAGLERAGIRLLINETIGLYRAGAHLRLTGLDDVHYFHTPAADVALADGATPGEGFPLCLVHSPDLARQAAAHGYGLYLCGHTHGGQVCLPGGLPVITRVPWRDWRRAVGLWRVGKMVGYTSPGLGTSGLPVRFFSRPEVTAITLRCADA